MTDLEKLKEFRAVLVNTLEGQQDAQKIANALHYINEVNLLISNFVV